ncbi:MAG: potassium transporter TrkA [Gammaproteobacteria bacterium]|nr:potassium transporter TrkA [Gammaproteobacteria bacterium]
MDTIFFIVMRRMRAPLITLVSMYSIAILGLVVIPGQDAAGNLWHMDFFHAFYFVSFMASTIGFGEIPFDFTEGQRLWVTITIYTTVVVWLYSIGTIISLVQDQSFKQALREQRFASRVKRLRDNFIIICGYGETGRELVRSLTSHDQLAVVVEEKWERINTLRMENLRQFVPGLCGDAGNPEHMLKAGLRHPLCTGVVALSNDNELNLKVAITTKLLHKETKVICRADSHDVEANMDSFGTDHIVDPFDLFSLYLATAFQAPCLYLIQEWLSGHPRQQLDEPVYPPKGGCWIVCGYGRFGKAVFKRLQDEGIEAVVIEMQPEKTGQPKALCIKGRGTEAVTLKEAGVETAIGLVAGTDDDVNNLSIIMTARELNPELFIIARQNRQENYALFDAVDEDMLMHPSLIVANRIRMLLSTPLLSDFLGLALFNDDAWACELVSRIVAMVDVETPVVWELEIDEESAPAFCIAIDAGDSLTLGEMLLSPRDRKLQLSCIALMHVRRDTRVLLPESQQNIKKGDRLLFCGKSSARSKMSWAILNENVLSYIRTGEARPEGTFWRVLHRMQRRQG